MKINKIRMFTILAASSFMATSALADFNISNQTKYDLSFQVNGICSQQFGKVYSWSIKNISEKTFMDACKLNAAPCEIKVYGIDSCQGEALLMVEYHVSDKNVSLYQYSSNISTGVSGYNLFLSDSPNAKKK